MTIKPVLEFEPNSGTGSISVWHLSVASQCGISVWHPVVVITGAVAVELMACTLQHPLGINAPAAVAGEHVNHEELPLGPVPHMIRGQLSGFTQMCLTGQAFRQCTACSQTVVDQYRQAGWSFLWQALQVTSRSDAGLASSMPSVQWTHAVPWVMHAALLLTRGTHACNLFS